MRKKFLLMFLVLSLFTSMGGGRLFAQTTTISSVEDLVAFATSVNGGTSYEGQTVTLTSDLNLSGEWTPIGNGSRSSKTYTGNSFKGIFDGGDHAISGLTITSTSGANAAVGLFGIVDGGTVKNLKLTDVNINVPSSNLAGAAIGMMLNGATADNITVSGAIVGNDGVGGIVGRLIIHGTISNCINNASVTSSYGGIGGIVGKPYYEDGANTSTFASITNCTNNGTVTAPMYIGGIAGLARANVTNCTNEGAIVGGTQTGGIVGQLIAAGTVSGNENKAKVSGKNHLGGIIGDYSQSSAYTYYNVSIANNINRGELAATEQCAAIMGCNNIDGFTAMTATGNVSYYYVEGLEMFGNPEDMVIDATNEFIIPVAKIGEQTFYTFAEAAAAAQTGSEIILLADATVEGTLALPAGIKLTSNGHTINGSIRMLGDLELNGALTITGGLWVGKSGETLTATLSGDKLTASYFMFQRGTYTINADIDAVYGYLSFEGTFEVNSTIHTTGANGEVLYIRGNVNLNADAVLDSDNSVFLDNDNAVLTLKPGSKVDSNVSITKSGAKLNIDATGMAAGASANITGTVTNSGNGTIAVVGNDNLEASIVDGKVVLNAKPAAKIGETPYTTLEAAYEAAVNGDVIVLNESVTTFPVIKKAVTFKGGKENAAVEINYALSQNFTAIDGIVRFENLTFNKPLFTEHGGNKPGLSIEFEGCNFNVNSEAGYGILIGTSWSNSVVKGLKVNNCNFKYVGTEFKGGYMLYVQCVNEVTITNNTIDGNNLYRGAIHLGDATEHATVATVSNNTIKNFCRGVMMGNRVVGSSATISGNIFDNINYSDKDSKPAQECAPIFIHSNATAEALQIALTNNEVKNCANPMIYSEDTDLIKYYVTEFTGNTVAGAAVELANSYNAPNQIFPVATINDAEYFTLQEAVNAAVNGDVVTLLADNAENVTVTQKPDVKFTIDGADKTMTGTITIDGKTAAYATAGITVKNMNFTAATEAVCINLGVSGNNNTRYTSNVTVERCNFTGTDKTAVGIKSYTGGDKNLIVNDCTATGMHSLMQLKNTAGVSVTECEITYSKNGISLGASSDVAINKTTVDCAGYGVRADANGDNGNATITDCTIEAFIPVVVRNVSKDYALQFNGTNTMTQTNTDGLWCAIGKGEYETNGTMPEAPATGQVTVTLNDTGLSMDGVYGEHFALNGEGTAESPYLINNLYELKGFRDQVNAGINYAGKYVKLAADIDLNNEEWTPIGNNNTETNRFQGYFDGNNKTISNLKVTGNTSYKGFFGYIKGTGMSATTTPSVKDLTLDGVNVNVEGDGCYVGGLAGQAYTCNITNVTVKGEVSGKRYVGGLVGHVYTYFKDCHFIGNASCSFDALGGIAGAGDCRAYDCSVIGDVTGSNWVGGIIGNGQEGTSAVGCYVKGDVKTSNNYYRGVGGIAGVAGHGYASSEFKNNYFNGKVYLGDVIVPAMIMGLVNASDNASIKATVEGNSWNTDYYDVNTPVYVVAEISSPDASLEDWIDGASEELTDERNNNLIMLESDLQYVTEEDYVIMSFSEVTEEQVEQALINNAVAKIGETTYTTLQKALNAAAAGTGNVTVEIIKDIDLTNVDWNPVTVSDPGYPSVTVNGNDKTITGLNDMLFSGTWAGGSGLIINNLTIASSTIVNDKDDTKGTVGVGAFIGFPQASEIITLNDCHLVNSTVEGGHWTGGLIGYAAGYAGEDGPVFMNLTIKDCSVTESTITGKGSVGGIIGHGSGNGWTKVVIEGTTVSDNTITSAGTSNNKAGAIMGTIGAAGQPTTANGVTLTGGATVSATVSDNTVKSNGTTITTIYGRQGTSTGMLELNGGSYDKYPIEEGVTYAAPVEGYEIVANTNGTYGVEKSAVAKIGDVEYKYLQAAIDAAGTAETTINVIANTTENITIQEGANITLEFDEDITLNGYFAPFRGKLTINGGTINNTNGEYSAIEINAGELNLNDVNIASARHAVRIDGDVEAIIDGGEYTLNATSGTRHAVNVSGGAEVTIEAGTFVGPYGTTMDSGSAVCVQSGATVTINGGDFSGGKNATLGVSGTMIVKGGTFDQNPSDYVPTGYTTQILDNGKYEVLYAIASIGTKYYGDLHEAMVAAKSGETVKLVNDVDLAGTEWEPVSFKGIFDGQDHTISNLTINKPGVSNTGFITSLNGTFKNVTFTNPTVTGGDCTAVVAGRAGGGAAYAHNITINGTIKVETTHSGYARTGGIVGGWAYGKYENITIDGGDKDTSYIKHTGGGDGRYVAGIVGHADDVESYTNCTVKNITISGGWLCGGIAGPGPADGLATGCSVENIDMGADYSGGMFGWYYGDGTIKDATVKDVTFTDGSTCNGAIGGYSNNEDATVKNVTIDNVKNENGAPIFTFAATIADGTDIYYYATLEAAFTAATEGQTITLLIDTELSEMITIPNGKTVVLDLNGKTITGTDNTTKNFSIIDNRGNLTITDSSDPSTGKITLTATTNSGWNRYSAVIANNPGGKLTIEAGTLEHLGGTDMAYGIDNLTNGKGTYAETVINGGYIKSTYRGIRQFLNGTEAQNILTVNGGTIEGANKSIWMQDPNTYANTGTLTVDENAKLVGDVYLYVTPESTSWPVEVSIANDALQGESKVMTGNVPAGYELQQDADGNYVVNQGVAKIDDVLYATVTEAINAAENGGTVQLLALTIDEYVAPWATDTQHTSEKSITIIGAENFGTTMTGGLYLGYDDSQCREHTIVVKGINFTGKGILVASQQNVIVEGNKFTDITDRVASSGSSDKNAISIIGKDVIATVKNNVITTTASVGIDLRNILTATVDGNTVTGTQHNSMQIQNASANSSAEIANNRFFDWGKSGEGRAMRINQIVTADVNNNVMINVNAPEEFVKITEHTTAEIDENYWNGANPTSSNTPAYFLAEGVQVHNYYAAYDAETNTLSDLVTIEGAGETLEIFYTAAGEVTEQANAAYSLMFTVTDYASKEVSVKIGNKNPAENKGCDLLIPSSVKFNDQDFAVTSIPVDGFKECKGFDKLVVPGTITSVSNSAFYNCLRLTEVVIEEGVQKLGSSTFYKILDLQTLTLPSTLTRIASLCFNGTHNIKTIVCNAQTPPTAFTGCFTESVYKNALLYVDGKYEDYKAANGWSNFKNILAVGATQTIDKGRYTLIATITDVWNRTCSVKIGTAPTNTKPAELAIPEHVSFSGIEFDITSIPEGGFQNCNYFEGTLTIPAYITSIGKSAFQGCTRVTALVVEDGVTSLGTSDTFRQCLNIETITLPSTLTTIPTRCFHNIQQKLKVVECHALVPPTLASQFTEAAYKSATLYVHDVDAYKEANNWKRFNSIRLIGAVAQNKETEVEYKSIAEAVAAANAGETVQMLQNVNLENTITVAAGKEVVLDLNGKTVSYTTTEHKGEAMITNNGNLTITDSAEGGKLSYAYEGGADPSYSFGNSTIENKGVLTINAGTVENTSAAMSHASYAINTGAGATLNVEGGNILNLNGHAVRMVSFGTTLNTVNIEGGYIEGTRALQVQLPGNASAAAPEMELNITGGELKSNEENYNLAIYVYSNGQSAENVSVEISGGTFDGNVAVNAAATNSMLANAVAITDGTFNGVYGVFSYSDEDAAQAVISITGGTFATNNSEWYAEDDYYVFEENIDGTYSVVEQTIFTQTTQLSAGWNWFSYYVNTDLETLEDELGESGIQIKSHSTGLFVKQDEEGDWYGSLETISPTEMYTINTSTNVTMEFIGEYVNPTTPIAIKYNWNAIGYMLNIPLSLDEALKTLNPQDGDYIKSKEGFAKFEDGEWEGSLETLNPGEGYMLKSVVNTERTLIYSSTRGTNVETKANITTDGNYWTPNASQYPNNMTMTAMVDVEGGDYEVAAFVDGEVRGSARPIYVESIDAYVLFLTIHGEGVDEMTFKFYDLTTGEEFDLNDRMNYSDDAIVGSLKEPYMFKRGTTGIGEAAMSEVNIYPNPTTTGTEINLQATCDKVEVFNALGVKVAEYQNVDSIDAIETAGIYVIRITNDSNVQNCRLVVK